MKRHNHPTRTAARTELFNCGFVPVHTRPGAPEVWVSRKKPYRHFAIGRAVRPRSEVFHIVPWEKPS